METVYSLVSLQKQLFCRKKERYYCRKHLNTLQHFGRIQITFIHQVASTRNSMSNIKLMIILILLLIIIYIYIMRVKTISRYPKTSGCLSRHHYNTIIFKAAYTTSQLFCKPVCATKYTHLNSNEFQALWRALYMRALKKVKICCCCIK